MRALSIVLWTLLGVMMNGTVALFSSIALDLSDGNYSDRLTSIIGSLDARTPDFVVWELKFCRAMFVFSTLLPFAEGLACVLAVVALLLFLLKKGGGAVSRLYRVAFALPFVVVVPLIIAAPMSAHLTRASESRAMAWAVFGVFYLLFWVFISGVSFLKADSSARGV